MLHCFMNSTIIILLLAIQELKYSILHKDFNFLSLQNNIVLCYFSPVTSSNVGVSPQNFLAYSFNPFATLV